MALSKEIIVVVDDEDIVLTSIDSFLSLETDYRVMTFMSAANALDFIKENDIRDLAQLDTFLKQITGVVLEETASCLRLSEVTILATPDTIHPAKRQRTQGMAIPRRPFAHLMER